MSHMQYATQVPVLGGFASCVCCVAQIGFKNVTELKGPLKKK